MIENMSEYFSGIKLIGDDYSSTKLSEWYEDEKEGYANLGSKKRDSYQYPYHELNNLVSYRHIEDLHFKKVLGIGSAYGDEFIPISHRIDDITILDPSEHFSVVNNIFNTPCKYVKPSTCGDMPFESNTFDLIVAFGVFHHIPNVTHVISECRRVLKQGGIMLIREPIVSMGDWRRPRCGLTKNERGIPFDLFIDIAESEFNIRESTLCNFAPLSMLLSKIGVTPYAYKSLTKIDLMLSKLFSWNINYHATKLIDKFRPVSLALVLKKS